MDEAENVVPSGYWIRWQCMYQSDSDSVLSISLKVCLFRMLIGGRNAHFITWLYNLL